VRKCLRRRPLSGSLHAVPSLALDTTVRCARTHATSARIFTRNTPRRRPLCESPLCVDRQFRRSTANAARIWLAYVARASECR
jgi:hypothetical protein